MAARLDKRNGLFRELAADYQKFRPEAVDTVACPLCLAEHSLADIADLSREHVVPSKLGGRSETLTCRRKCNNTHGSRLDSHLINAMRAMDAVEGAAPIPTVLGSDKGKIVAEVFLPFGPEPKPEPFRIQIVGKASNMEARSPSEKLGQLAEDAKGRLISLCGSCCPITRCFGGFAHQGSFERIVVPRATRT